MSQNRSNKNKKLNISFRVLLFYSIFPFVLFTLIAVILYFNQRNKIYTDASNQMKKNIRSLITSVEIDLLRIKEKNQIALNTFKVFTSTNKLFFDFSEKKLDVTAYNYKSGVEQNIKIQNWKYRNDSIYKNSDFLNSVSLSLKNELVIAQKTTEGYITIASSKDKLELQLFPFSTNLIYTIENGETYKGQIKIGDIEYLVSASPFYVNGKIQGMLMSLEKNEFSEQLSELFGSQIYFKRGYPFALDQKGTLVLHPTLPYSSIKNTNLFKRIQSHKNSPSPVKIEYIWPENENGEEKSMYVKYLPEIDLYIGTTYYLSDFKSELNKLKIYLIIAVLASTIILSVTLIFISIYFTKKIEKTLNLLESLSKGIIPKEKYSEEDLKKQNPEADVKLINNFKRLQDFTEKLKKHNYSANYKPWSEYDIIGENLISLNNHLRKNKEKAIEKAEEQERLVWMNEGMAKFIEILKYQVIEIKDLAYKIISQIVEYIGANEGGFFIIKEDEGKDNKYLELLAAYAMHKEKLINRKVELGVGLVGRVALEKKTLFLTEIPDSYSKISTALGQGKPKSIVVLPLIFSDEIIGVIELASFKVLSDLQLEFLERISENISANLAMWRASQQTAELLQETREQTRVQKKQQKTLEEHLKELEKLREESEQREIELNSIIKAVDTTALLVEYDKNGKITSANNRFLDTLGKIEEEIIGKHHQDFTSMDVNSSEYKEFWKELLEGKTKRFIESFHIQDDTVWLSQNYVPILDKDENVFKILNIAIDITENKILERQLRGQVREISKEARTVRKEQRKVRRERENFLNKENAYKAIIQAANDFIGHIEFTIDGKITFVNKIFAQYLDFDAELLIDRNIRDYIYSKDIETFKLAIEKAKKGDSYSSKIKLLNSKKEIVELKYTIAAAINTKNKAEKIILITKK